MDLDESYINIKITISQDKSNPPLLARISPSIIKIDHSPKQSHKTVEKTKTPEVQSIEIQESQKRKNQSPLSSPSPSASSSKPKKVKHTSDEEYSELERTFWKNIHSYDDFSREINEKIFSIAEDYPNQFTLVLAYILRNRIIDLEKKLYPQRSSEEQNLDQFNQSLHVTKDGRSKILMYRYKKSNGEYISKTDMKKNLSEYMKRLSSSSYACKGTPKCTHEPLAQTGRNNKIYDHLRKMLGWTMECIYCPFGNNSNMEQFTKHLKKYHFDQIDISHLKNQESEPEAQQKQEEGEGEEADN